MEVKRMERKFLTTKEIAEIVGVSDQTVCEWIRRGKLEAVKMGIKWFIPIKEVEEKFGIEVKI